MRASARALVLLCVCGGLPPIADLSTSPLAAAEGRIEFLAPRNLSTVVGPGEISLRVQPPSGVAVDRVELFVDDELLVVLTEPPWKAAWDAGDGSRGHALRAVLRLSDGSTATAFVRTTRLRIDAVEDVNLVNLYLVARDKGGRYVNDLRAEDLTVVEDGRRQTIKLFTAEPKPLAIGIVLDVSVSMRGKKLDAARESALAFLKALEPTDRAMVVGFSDYVEVLQELTASREALGAAISSVRAVGGTALYDAIWKVSEELRTEDARRVMVLLSDGRDEASNGLEPGSLHTLQEALDHALRCEVMVFAIGFGQDLDRPDFFQRFTQEQILTRLGETTGGRVLFPRRNTALRKAFEAVGEDLRHQYALAYTPDNENYDGAWREVRIIPSDPEIEIVTRSGYFAEPPGDR